MSMSTGEKVFEPWVADYRMASVWFAGGVFGDWLLAFWDFSMLGVLFSIWTLMSGWRWMMSGIARENGIKVERQAIEDFATQMPAGEYFLCWDIQMQSRGVYCGNIDLVARPIWSEAGFVIEIKSSTGIVRRWFGWTWLGKYYRLWSPQRQVKSQCRYLGQKWNFPVIWLPESKLGNWFVDCGILVVNGNVGLLFNALRAFDKLIQKQVVVKFPYAPGKGMTGFLKGRGYKYDWDAMLWNGAETDSGVSVMRQMIAGQGGVVYLRQR